MFQNPTAHLTPMTPDAVLSAFSYLRAMEAGDAEAAAGSAGADLRMPALLVDIAERIIVPVTALCGLDPDPCDGSFALEAAGRVLVATLRAWAQAGPDAVEGVAHAVIDFVRQVLTEEESGETVAGVLRQIRPSTSARPSMRTPHYPVRTRCARSPRSGHPGGRWCAPCASGAHHRTAPGARGGAGPLSPTPLTTA
ncbi:hypothetical protein ACLGI4_00210 [Streptomyces sp. HMX112]|uniref:hypothetical protein n=1 Tax=Streptomyces sp. HMX112 TaxID=3390850 RepID=UPI003A807FFC